MPGHHKWDNLLNQLPPHRRARIDKSVRQTTSDPTRAAWLAALLPGARRTIASLWHEPYRFALLDAGPRRRDRKGRLSPSAGLETNQSRADAFYALRYQISQSLTTGAMTADQARQAIAASPFPNDLLLATSPEEAAEHLASFLRAGHNALLDSAPNDSILWITTWRE